MQFVMPSRPLRCVATQPTTGVHDSMSEENIGDFRRQLRRRSTTTGRCELNDVRLSSMHPVALYAGLLQMTAGSYHARVLLVDDEPLILSAYRRTLTKTAAEILLANGPLQGLEVLQREAVDVVIADYRMPEMNGDAFLEQVRQCWPNTVRILVTAYTDVQIIEETVRRGGIFRFLTKPCDTEKLRQAIAEAIAESRTTRQRQLKTKKRELDLHSYRHLFKSAPDPMMIADLDGVVFEVNDALVTQVGGSRDDALRQRPHIVAGQQTIQSEGSVPLDWQEIRQKIAETGSWSGEVQRDDQYYALSVSHIEDDEGKPYAYAAIERNITTRRRLEEAARSAQYEVILALAKLAEYRDPETGAHLERMRRYSQVLARTMGRSGKYVDTIDDAYVEAIFFSSPLHDIGKVGIPDSVLLKPGKLTAEEWAKMQEHAEIGAEVLSAAGDTLSQKEWLSMARTIALQHHEKVDGGGYPQGLQGDEIDLSAKIVALADAYDAITSKRVYKDAIPHEEARRRILEASGSHFDPAVVEAFLASEREFIQIRRCHSDDDQDAPNGGLLRQAS